MGAVDTLSSYSHINILVDDLEAAHRFYIDTLGFEVLPRPDFGAFRGAWYRVGQLQLHLSVVEEMPDLKGGFPHLAFYLASDAFDSTVETLKSAGIEFLGDAMAREDFGMPVRAIFCKDPSGNPIELTDVPPFVD